MTEISTKPYLIRAIHEWCIDNGYTPYLAVSVNKHTLVPAEHVKAGEIILNCSPLATQGLLMGNELVEFQARFGGIAQHISIPVEQVSAIYARENGQGMAFEVPKPPAEVEEFGLEVEGPDTEDSPKPRSVSGPVLSAVPDGSTSEQGNSDDEPPEDDPNGGGTSKKEEKKSSGKRKNHLTRVK